MLAISNLHNVYICSTVYLRTDPECVYDRIIQRARPEEKVVEIEYVKQLHDRHEEWLLSGFNGKIPYGTLINKKNDMLPHCPVLVIDSTKSIKEGMEQIRDVVVPVIQKLNNRCFQQSAM